MILSANQIGELTQLILQNMSNMIAIYLFGSGAGDSYHSDSDVDLAVLNDQVITTEQWWDLNDKISTLLGRNVDLVDLNNVDTVFQMQIVSKGVKLFDIDSETSGSFENRIYQLFMTLNEDRQEIIKGIIEDQSVYG